MPGLRALLDRALRVPALAAHAILKAGWFVRRPRTFGAHAIALTPEGKIILVKLRYAPGWRVPGGGRAELEDPVDAALRELREEVGMISHGEARLVRDLQEPTDFKRDTASLVMVDDVRYRPARWSWEVERVCEAEPGSLPADTPEVTRRWVETVLPLI